MDFLGSFELVGLEPLCCFTRALSSILSSSLYVGMKVAEAMRAETREGGGGEILRRLGAGGLLSWRTMSCF